MATPKPITYDGTTWKSMSALARANGVKAVTLHMRLERGWSLAQAVGDQPPPARAPRPTGRPVEWDGDSYPSMAALAEKVGVASATISARLKRGWSMDQAVGAVPPPDRGPSPSAKSITFRGRVYESRSALAEAFEVKPKVLLSRLREGWDLEAALGLAEQPYVPGRGKGIVCDGERYASVKDLSDQQGVAYTSVTRRLGKGWTPEQAVGLMPSPRELLIKEAASVDIAVCSFDSNRSRVVLPSGSLPLRTFTSARGANYSRAKRRLRAGQSLRDALADGDRRQQSPTTGVTVTANGTTFPSLRRAAEALGVTYDVVKRRRQLGWTVGQALGVGPSPAEEQASRAAAELATGMRICSSCGVEKRLEEDFAVNSVGVNGRDNACSSCRQAGRRTRIFGLEPHEYEAQLERQAGLCAICGTAHPGGNRWAIDHDHETGFVRGLLCTACNAGLGHFEDDVERLRRAIDYLGAPPWPPLEGDQRAAQVSHKLGVRWTIRSVISCRSCSQEATTPVEAFELFPLRRRKRRGSYAAEDTFEDVCSECEGAADGAAKDPRR